MDNGVILEKVRKGSPTKQTKMALHTSKSWLDFLPSPSFANSFRMASAAFFTYRCLLGAILALPTNRYLPDLDQQELLCLLFLLWPWRKSEKEISRKQKNRQVPRPEAEGDGG
jgi:hypothetical protein